MVGLYTFIVGPLPDTVGHNTYIVGLQVDTVGSHTYTVGPLADMVGRQYGHQSKSIRSRTAATPVARSSSSTP